MLFPTVQWISIKLF